MPAPSRVLRHMRGLRTLLDARDSRDLGEGVGGADGGADDERDDEDEDSGGNADDEVSDALCALCALGADGDRGTATASLESDDDDDDAWTSRPRRMAPAAAAGVAAELSAERRRRASAPGAAGPAWVARRPDGLDPDAGDSTLPSVGGPPRRWRSEVVGGGGYASGGSGWGLRERWSVRRCFRFKCHWGWGSCLLQRIGALYCAGWYSSGHYIFRCFSLRAGEMLFFCAYPVAPTAFLVYWLVP